MKYWIVKSHRTFPPAPVLVTSDWPRAEQVAIVVAVTTARQVDVIERDTEEAA